MSKRLIRTKLSFRFIGGKMIRKYNLNLISLPKASPKINLMINHHHHSKKDKLPCKIASNYSRKLKHWQKIMRGTAPPAKISYWLLSKCKFIKHQKY